MGLKGICSKRSGGYLSGFEQGMGWLFLMASPIHGLFRYGVGIPVALGSAVATAATGAAYAFEAAGRAVEDKLCSPSEATQLREHLAEKFAERMKTVFESLSFKERHEKEKNLPSVVGMAIISVAFLSRNQKGMRIKAGDEMLTMENINDMNSICKEYFKDICAIKDAISELCPSPHDDHAWKILMEDIQGMKMDSTRNETLAIMLQMTADLSEKVLADKLIMSAWNKFFE
jgi:hypothetical protein